MSSIHEVSPLAADTWLPRFLRKCRGILHRPFFADDRLQMASAEIRDGLIVSPRLHHPATEKSVAGNADIIAVNDGMLWLE
ncbi:hypothetical protein AAKU55_005369 [Oxalobacteraceae bacterium GrIS 1.11]